MKQFLIIGLLFLSNCMHGQRLKLDTTIHIVLDTLVLADSIHFNLTVPTRFCNQFFDIPIVFSITDTTSVYRLVERRFVGGRGELKADNTYEKYTIAEFLTKDLQMTSYWKLSTPMTHCETKTTQTWYIALAYTICEKKNYSKKRMRKKIPITLSYQD